MPRREHSGIIETTVNFEKEPKMGRDHEDDPVAEFLPMSIEHERKDKTTGADGRYGRWTNREKEKR
ncbi:hypothetical protein K0M31_001518 [Melipona bicolor]|uniref:Uncharacterized protein n=1 Tax=Melipona bicolor TaxID=60889 RepID=A0AA40GGV0_9HYME|nr:hypothetical protein K0M31_001518 [Melipona bicolor]